MTAFTAHRMILAPRARVAHVLTCIAELAEWNPALLGVAAPDRVATIGREYRVTTRVPGPATLRYAETSAERIVWVLTVVGGVEVGEWDLQDARLPDTSDSGPQVDSGSTVVTHTVRHSGLLPRALRSAMRPVPALRLDRLADRL